ncbi:hypothetical protein BV25DRAFT_695916 [Artomyces pyxidatus]|uniref:Uncharacterized protein n=1 Tax=Artomyces pyxidatus TaxID=48021 RepID=A0ACB8T1Q5_9AGAM|nr:hypothetical protein BV25DRAFT_695916 [Artomyces pyxidatus]
MPSRKRSTGNSRSSADLHSVHTSKLQGDTDTDRRHARALHGCPSRRSSLFLLIPMFFKRLRRFICANQDTVDSALICRDVRSPNAFLAATSAAHLYPCSVRKLSTRASGIVAVMVVRSGYHPPQARAKLVLAYACVIEGALDLHASPRAAQLDSWRTRILPIIA